MTKQQREKLAQLKRELSQPKSRLLDILRQIEDLSPAQGRRLGRAIAIIETFQNR